MSKFSLLGRSAKRQRDKIGEEGGSVPRARSVVQATYVSVSDRVYKRVDIQPAEVQQPDPSRTSASTSCSSEREETVEATPKVTRAEPSPPPENSLNNVFSGFWQWLALDEPAISESVPSVEAATHPAERSTKEDEQPLKKPIPPPSLTKKARRSTLPSSIILRESSSRPDIKSVPRMRKPGTYPPLIAEKSLAMSRTAEKASAAASKREKKKLYTPSESMSATRSNASVAQCRESNRAISSFPYYKPSSRRPQLKIRDVSSSCHKPSPMYPQNRSLTPSNGICQGKTSGKTKICQLDANSVALASRSVRLDLKSKVAAPPRKAVYQSRAPRRSLSAPPSKTKLTGPSASTNVKSAQETSKSMKRTASVQTSVSPEVDSSALHEFHSPPPTTTEDTVQRDLLAEVDTDKGSERGLVKTSSIGVVRAPFAFLFHQAVHDEVPTVGAVDCSAKDPVDGQLADCASNEDDAEALPDKSVEAVNDASARDPTSVCLSPFSCFCKQETSDDRSTDSVASLEQTSSSSSSSSDGDASYESSDGDASTIVESKKYRLTISCEAPTWLR